MIIRRILSFAAILVVLIFGSFTASASTLSLYSCTTADASTDVTASVCISRDVVTFDGPSTGNRFYVSWLSPRRETGQVQVLGGGTYSDVRGSSYLGRTHYVEVNNVAANTTYQFDVISGGRNYTNGGAHWTTNVGPSIAPRTPDTIFGQIKNPDGSNAVGALVYIFVRDANGMGTPGRSALLSDVITPDDTGYFNVDLGEARLRNHSDLFSYSPSGDRLVIRAVGRRGRASATVDTSRPRPGKPTLTLTLQ